MEIGTTLGGYRVDAVAGQGGMGVVYRATQLGLGRPVALKVIAGELATSIDFRERFKAEARLAASIDHPNVVPIYEAGEDGGVLFLAMRFVEGTDLRALAESAGGLEPERAVRLVWQVAAALDAAHRRGLVHRDVKPPNVLVAGADGEHAYLTDFGLTKQTTAAGGLTRSGQFVGTPDFVAPEQIRGEGADARADVYALGCLLYHALTGRPPFVRDSELARMYAHLSDPPPAASAVAAGIPVALDAVIARGMAKDPDARHASAGDLARAAWAALEDDVAPARTGSVARGDAAAGVRPATAGAQSPGAAAGSPGSPVPAATVAPRAGVPPTAPEPAGWPRRRRVALLAALPTLLALGIAAALLAGTGAIGRGTDSSVDGPTGATATATPGEQGLSEPRITATIDVGDGPDGIAVDGDKVFVSNSKDGTLNLIDGRAGKIVGAPVKVGRNPDQIAAAKGVVWVADAGGSRLQRLETANGLVKTATVPIGRDAQGISLGQQLVWVANSGDDTVSRVDRAAADVVGDVIGVGSEPIGVFVGSSVWVTNSGDGTVTRLDVAAAKQIGAPIRVGDGPRGVTEGLGAVWVSNTKDGTVSRIDPESGRVEATIKVGRRPKDIVTGHGFVWVVNSGSNTVTRIDPKTDRVIGSGVPVGQTPIGIAIGARAVWVANFDDDTVTRIET